MKARHQSIRIFENPFLERLTHVHPIVPLVLWAPVISFFLFHSIHVSHISWGVVGVIGFFGLLSWTLLEYTLHRFLFHMPTDRPFSRRLQFIIHGLHHEDPLDPTRLVMPPAAGIILAFGLYNLFRFLLGPVYVEPFFGFFLIGYLCYDYTHYFVHHRIPKNSIAKRIRAYHLKHHFATPDARWGVSTPLWDYVLGTMGPKDVPINVAVTSSPSVAMPASTVAQTGPQGEIHHGDHDDSYLTSNALR